MFITLYVSQNLGFYNYEMEDRKIVTEENIKQFEQDIKENKPIDINNYVESTHTHENNGIARFNNSISSMIGNVMKETIQFGSNVFEILFK